MKILISVLALLFVTSVCGQNSSLPITLSSPFDKDTIEETTPNFMWQANLTSIQNDIRLSQVIVVTQLMSNQTATESIIENDPIFYRTDLMSNTIQYASSETELEEGKTYAWQIQYLYNDVLIQQSDVWQFTLAKNTPPLNEFVAVRPKNDGNLYPIYNKRLNVLTTESGELALQAHIQDEKGNKTRVNFSELVDGEFVEQDNSISSNQTRYFSIDLKELDLKKGNYSIEWTAKRGTSYTLNFILD